MSPERILFVTGKLAETSLRRILEPLAVRHNFEAKVTVLGISVAALLHVDWVVRKLPAANGVDRVILPGWCQGDLNLLRNQWQVPVELGPKDLFNLPEFFGDTCRKPVDLTEFDIEILAEINHAPRLTPDELLHQANALREQGADIIDLGCIPGEIWTGIGNAVNHLKSEGHRLSIDSFQRQEVEQAIEQGAELVLSANSSNAAWARDFAAEWVVVPDDPKDMISLETTAEMIAKTNSTYRLDPILEPIGFGFAASLLRYYQTRARHPNQAMLMGIGNLTELSDVDSAGINFVLAAICQELNIRSVLTTNVINWCRTAVKEFDIARRIVKHSITHHVLPKRISDDLVLLRDPKLVVRSAAEVQDLAAKVTDPNFRIFAERGEIHLLNREGYWHGDDPYDVFDRALTDTGPIDSQHAFYIGYELCKARTALTLGKNYVQDQALRWGFLTQNEVSAVARRKHGERNT